MRFIPVDELPAQHTKRFKKRNADHLREFLNMKVKYAKMDISDMDYTHPYSAYSSTVQIVKFHGLPIKTKLINSEVYLINLEVEDKL